MSDRRKRIRGKVRRRKMRNIMYEVEVEAEEDKEDC